MKTLFSSLRARIALLILIAVLPGLGLLMFNNLEQRRQAAELVREEAMRLVQVASNSQEDSIEGTRQLLLTLALIPEVRDGNQRECSALLANVREQNLRYANLGTINPDGYAVCSALPHSGSLYLGDRSYFQEALATRKFAAGEYQVGRITGRSGINFGYPVFNEDGEVQAVVFAALDLEWLNELAADLDLEEGVVLFTIDHEGTILNRYPDGGQWLGQPSPEAPIVETVLARQGPGAAEMPGLDGLSRLYAFRPLSEDTETGAFVVLGIPTEAAYAAADRVLIRGLAALVVLSLLFLTAIWIFAEYAILSRVRAMAEAARRLAAGDLSVRTRLPYNAGELGQLAKTFDEMADTLERRLRRLQALNTIDRAITTRYELQQTFDIVLEQVLVELDVGAAMILLLDDEGRYLEYAAGRGFRSDSIATSRLKVGEGYTGRVALKGRPLFIRDLENAEGFVQAPLIKEEDFVSYCSVPLVAKGELQGVLSVLSRTTLDFEKEWVSFLEALALQAAIAIDNSRLMNQTREQARQLQQIGDILPEGILLLDGQRRVILANPLGERYACKLAGATVGDTVKTLGDEPVEAFLEPVGEDEPWHELTLSEQEQIFEIGSQPVRDNGQLEGWVLIVREVTEERQRQEYLRTHDRLATLGQAAAGIAHDFNNILSVISMQSEVLERHPEHPNREKYIATIGHQARVAAELVSQILDFSRASEMKRVRLDVSAFLEEQAGLLVHVLPPSVKVALDVDSGEHVVEADPTRLQQVLMNLAVNAGDAMPKGGHLQLALSRLSLAPGGAAPLPDMEAGDYVCLSVSDTGPGIARDVLPRIFEPFFTTKPRGRGTGLGLAQVYGLVKQHGGAIDVKSEPGEGTTFVIYLPASTD